MHYPHQCFVWQSYSACVFCVIALDSLLDRDGRRWKRLRLSWRVNRGECRGREGQSSIKVWKGKCVKTAVILFIQTKIVCILNRNPLHEEKKGERPSKLVLNSVKHNFPQVIILLVHLEGRCWIPEHIWVPEIRVNTGVCPSCSCTGLRPQQGRKSNSLWNECGNSALLHLLSLPWL